MPAQTFSFKPWLTFMTVATAMVVLACVGLYVGYSQNLRDHSTHTWQQLSQSARIAAVGLSSEDLDLLQSPEDAESIPAQHAQSVLSAVVKGSDSATAANLYRVVDGKAFFLASAADGKSTQGQLFDELDNPGLGILEPRQAVTREIVSDRWGEWLAAYVPVKNSEGQIVAVVESKLDLQSYKAGQIAILRRISLSAGIVVIGLLGLAWVVSGIVRKRVFTRASVVKVRASRAVLETVLVLGAIVILVDGFQSYRAFTSNPVGLAGTLRTQEAQNARVIRLASFSLLLTVGTLLATRAATNRAMALTRIERDGLQRDAQYAGIVENLPVGLAIFESNTVSFANPEWRAQFNYDPIGRPGLAILDHVQEEDREHVAEVLDQALTYAKPFAQEFRTVGADGSTRHMEFRGVPVYESDGICRRVLAFSIDVSDIVFARDALQAAYGEVDEKNKLLGGALTELEENLQSVVRALVKAVEAKDPYTAGHSERVMQYSLWLGERVGLGPYEMRILELGTLVHDVGKIGIPDAILTKPDKLTDEEFAVIKKHPEYGVDIIKNIGLFRECIPIVRWHHERLDGRGYPDGLAGDEIPMLVRISAIADIFDAMTSTRAYRDGMPIDKVLGIMHDIAEKGEIDAQLFAAFCSVILERGIIAQTERIPTAA